MKKIYQTPSTDQMLLNIENVMQTTSPVTLPKGNETDTVEDKEELLGRRHNDVWAEEEEEEEY